MATYKVLYWREIPSQLKVAEDGGGTPFSHPLEDWFMALIDRVAMREGLVGSDAYLEQWRWGEEVSRPGEAAEVAVAVAAELAERWEPVRRGRMSPEDVAGG